MFDKIFKRPNNYVEMQKNISCHNTKERNYSRLLNVSNITLFMENMNLYEEDNQEDRQVKTVYGE